MLVVVDKLSNWLILVPKMKMLPSEHGSVLFRAHVFSKHGVPRTITFDTETRFTADQGKEYTSGLCIECNMSTSDHPQTHDRSENSKSTVSSILRRVIQKAPKEIEKFLQDIFFDNI